MFDKETVSYDGHVYDLTLERNHIMYIRRKGKCFWGSNCMCYCVPILKSEDEFWADDDGAGSENAVTDVPDKVHEWVEQNRERIERASERATLPYWLRDNPQILEGVAARRVEPALREIIEETPKDIHDTRDTLSPELRARIDLNNERNHEYRRLLDDPDYKDVRFDERNGGLMATHKDHKVHENDNKKYFAEQLNGDQLGRKNKQLAKYNTIYGETNNSVCMYFHEPSYYSYEKIEAG